MDHESNLVALHVHDVNRSEPLKISDLVMMF